MKKILFWSFLVTGILIRVTSAAAAGNVTVTTNGFYDPGTGQIQYHVHWQAVQPVTQVQISATLPAGTTFLSAGENGLHSGNMVIWNLQSATLTSGDVQYTVILDAAAALSPWAGKVISFAAGNGQATTVPPSLQDATAALSAPDGKVVALGTHSGAIPNSAQLVLQFNAPVSNASGTDIQIFSPNSAEQAHVETSIDGSNWTDQGTVIGSGFVDLGTVATAQYLRLTDTTSGVTNSFGYEIDAVKNLHAIPFSCGIQDQVTVTVLNGSAVDMASASGRVDLVSGCAGSYGNSGISGIVSIGTATSTDATGTVPILPGSNGSSTTTATSTGSNILPVGDSSGTSGGTNGTSLVPSTTGNSGSGSSSSAGGGGTPNGGTPVLQPTDAGGSNEPQVLGTATSLPRTGMPVGLALSLVPVAMVLTGFIRKIRPKK